MNDKNVKYYHCKSRRSMRIKLQNARYCASVYIKERKNTLKNIRFFHSSFFLLVCFLLFLLTACGSTATTTANHPTLTGKKMVVTQKQTLSADETPSAQGNTTPSTTTVAMPATQTSCPADGTAR